MHQIIVNGIFVDVVRKNIKNLRLAVYPPNGRVRVAAPLLVNDEAVRLAVISRLAWIRRQQEKFKLQERPSICEFVSGEGHYFLGKRYLLNVVYHNGPALVVIRHNTIIDLIVREGSDPAQREKVLLEWYRQQLKELIPPLIDQWQNIIGVTVSEWWVKRMKTHWGTCNIQERRIWLNLEQVKKPIQCLEYVIVHEMVHLLERRHNQRFKAAMDRLLPYWKTIKEELNQGL